MIYNILPSSQPKIVEFSNPSPKRECEVIFTYPNEFIPEEVKINITHKVERMYELVETITATDDGTITANTFNKSGSVRSIMMGLAECLKRNKLFYDVRYTLEQNRPVVRAKIDNSDEYTISSNFLSISGDYATYKKVGLSKTVLNYTVEDRESFSQEKINGGESTKFDIASPFDKMTFIDPINVSLNAYTITDNVPKEATLNKTQYLVLPTTLKRFETFNYSKYMYDSANPSPIKWLTNRTQRWTRLKESQVLSYIGNEDLRIFAKFYTNSGFLIYQNDLGVEWINKGRVDCYFDLDCAWVETFTASKVGYVDVELRDWSNNIISEEPVRYYVTPSCSQNLSLYFTNKIGGVDCYNHLNRIEETSAIANTSNYFVNTMSDNETKERYRKYEMCHGKKMNQHYTVTTEKIKRDEVEWLKELQASKFVFRESDKVGYYQMVVIDSMEIQLNDRTDDYTVTLSFYDYGNEIVF